MTDVGFTHVALEVTNLDASIEFYAAYARMNVVHRRDGVVWLSDGTRAFVIVLIETERVRAELRPFAHLGVACESHAEVDRLCAIARSEKTLLDGPTESGPPVGYWAFLRDPDGHTLEISFGQEVGWTVEQGS
jgi:catechol 2,3-dioxygenase-like lactoylglutathione lyase family enzyme